MTDAKKKTETKTKTAAKTKAEDKAKAVAKPKSGDGEKAKTKPKAEDRAAKPAPKTQSQAKTEDTTPKSTKLDELYELIDEMEIAMMTTRNIDGMLVTRPMDTQKRGPDADLWFVTNIEDHKVDELIRDSHISLGYYNSSTREWVCVSGIATITQDRKKIHQLYKPDWKAWMPDEGGKKDGGPDDPRIALIFVDAHSAHYMKSKHSRPRQLFEVALGIVTGKAPDVGREEHLEKDDLH